MFEGSQEQSFFPSNTLIYGISRDGSKNFNIRTCEHMILGQLSMGARQAKNAPLCTVCIFLALSLYLSKLQLICQAQQALATFKSFVLSLLLRLMRARDSNLSSICYFVSKFCIASVCICAITPTEVFKIKGCKQGSGW